MKNGKKPSPNVIHPIKGYDKEIYIKPSVKNQNIIVGEFSYIADSDPDQQRFRYSQEKIEGTAVMKRAIVIGSPGAGKNNSFDVQEFRRTYDYNNNRCIAHRENAPRTKDARKI